MKKIKLSFLSDALFLFISAFLFFYGVTKPKLIKPVLTATTSSLLSIVVTVLYTAFSVYRYGKKSILKNEEDQFLAFINHLAFLDTQDINTLFANYFEKVCNIVFTPRKNGLFCSDKNLYVLYDFNPDGITKQNVLQAYKKTKTASSIIFIAVKYDSEVVKFFSPLAPKIKLYSANELYNSLKQAQLLPKLEVKKPDKKPFIELVKSTFHREKSTKFALWGGAIILFSTITYYKGLYLFIGSLLLIFACYLRLFTKPAGNKNKVITA